MANGSAGVVIDEENATKGVAVEGGWQDYTGYLNIRRYCVIGILLALVVGYELDLGLQRIWAINICEIAIKIAILISITNLTKRNGQQKKQLPNSIQPQKVDVFLSHSGKQKNFVRQLHKDLTNLGVSCFFDEDSESLPVGEDFPPRIFEAARTCKLAVLLLSKDFLESKWPMLEASTFVKARANNTDLQILPLFFTIPPKALKVMDKEKWKGIDISEDTRVEWQKALESIRKINGLMFNEGGNEVEFREKIRKEIWQKLKTQLPRYHVPFLQGEERMCQEVANFVKTIHPNEKGLPRMDGCLLLEQIKVRWNCWSFMMELIPTAGKWMMMMMKNLGWSFMMELIPTAGKWMMMMMINLGWSFMVKLIPTTGKWMMMMMMNLGWSFMMQLIPTAGKWMMMMKKNLGWSS